MHYFVGNWLTRFCREIALFSSLVIEFDVALPPLQPGAVVFCNMELHMI